MPAARPRFWSVSVTEEVTAMMGELRDAPHVFLISIVASYPFRAGIWQSMRMARYGTMVAAMTASTPLSTTSTQKPRCSSMAVATFWLTGLSSASRMRSDDTGVAATGRVTAVVARAGRRCGGGWVSSCMERGLALSVDRCQLMDESPTEILVVGLHGVEMGETAEQAIGAGHLLQVAAGEGQATAPELCAPSPDAVGGAGHGGDVPRVPGEAELRQEGLGVVGELLDQFAEKVLLGRLIEETELSEDGQVEAVTHGVVVIGPRDGTCGDGHVLHGPGHQRQEAVLADRLGEIAVHPLGQAALLVFRAALRRSWR